MWQSRPTNDSLILLMDVVDACLPPRLYLRVPSSYHLRHTTHRMVCTFTMGAAAVRHRTGYPSTPSPPAHHATPQRRPAASTYIDGRERWPPYPCSSPPDNVILPRLPHLAAATLLHGARLHTYAQRAFCCPFRTGRGATATTAPPRPWTTPPCSTGG